ncbi:hypothetical protein CR513_19009, partial [Mucuna pruriens]
HLSSVVERVAFNHVVVGSIPTDGVLIYLLPKFHGLVGEDPHKHPKKFHVVCSTMRPHEILKDYLKIKAFPFSLDGVAKDYLYQPTSVNT